MAYEGVDRTALLSIVHNQEPLIPGYASDWDTESPTVQLKTQLSSWDRNKFCTYLLTGSAQIVPNSSDISVTEQFVTKVNILFHRILVR